LAEDFHQCTKIAHTIFVHHIHLQAIFLFFFVFSKMFLPRGRFRGATPSVKSRSRLVAGKRIFAGRVCGWLKKECF
jgi:hypothetical protein